MDFGINPSYFTRSIASEEPRSLESAIDLCVRHGLCALLMPSRLSEARAEALGSYIAQKGAYVHQTHLPYYRYTKDVNYGEAGKTFLECAARSHTLGAQTLVVHIDEFDFKAADYTRERVADFNRRLLTPVVDYAVKSGMRVAFENVFVDMGLPRFGSQTEELLAFTESFGCDAVGICWDFGHAKMQYPDAYVAAFDAVADQVIATHLHDNYYGKDLHVAPFLGNTDWAPLMEICRSKAAGVPLTLELVYGTLPQALHESYAVFLAEGCRTLLEL